MIKLKDILKIQISKDIYGGAWEPQEKIHLEIMEIEEDNTLLTIDYETLSWENAEKQFGDWIVDEMVLIINDEGDEPALRYCIFKEGEQND